MDVQATMLNIERKLHVLRNVATEALSELAELKGFAAPVKPKRISKKQREYNELAANVDAGIWRKPIHLRKTKPKP